MTTATPIAKQLIVNGKLNPSLTTQEFGEIASEQNRLLDACWNIVVEMTSNYNSPTSLNWKDAPNHDALGKMIFENESKKPVEVAVEIFEKYKTFQSEHKALTYLADINKGETLGASLKAFCPTAGELLVTTGQLTGLLRTFIESFNNFNKGTMSCVANAVNELNITNNYGVNNPSTGLPCTFWNIDLGRRDGIELVYTTDGSGITELTLEEINAKEAEIRTLLKRSKPDYIKRKDHFWPNLDGEGMSKKIHHVTFSMWWD